MTECRKNWTDPVEKRINALERQLKKVERSLTVLPEGRLTVSMVSGTPRYYLAKGREGGNGLLYLGQSQEQLIEKLGRRRYLEKLKKSLEKELRVLRYSVEHLPAPAPEDVYAGMHPALQAIVDPLMLSDEQYREWWLQDQRAGASGEALKSRIEKIIDQFYTLQGIAHVYEPALYLDGYGPARPDFVVLEPKTRRTIYHEHFGMMDKEDYRHKNMAKLASYHANGYYEGINLIITMEGEHNPIDTDVMEEMLRAYFK